MRTVLPGTRGRAADRLDRARPRPWALRCYGLVLTRTARLRTRGRGIEQLAHAAGRRPAGMLEPAAVGEQRRRTLGELAGVIDRKSSHARGPVEPRSNPRPVARDHRHAARQRLERSQVEALEARRQEGAIGGVQVGDQRITVHLREELDAVRAKRGAQLLELPAVTEVVATDDGEAYIGPAPSGRSHRHERAVDALARLDPADEQRADGRAIAPAPAARREVFRIEHVRDLARRRHPLPEMSPCLGEDQVAGSDQDIGRAESGELQPGPAALVPVELRALALPGDPQQRVQPDDERGLGAAVEVERFAVVVGRLDRVEAKRRVELPVLLRDGTAPHPDAHVRHVLRRVRQARLRDPMDLHPGVPVAPLRPVGRQRDHVDLHARRCQRTSLGLDRARNAAPRRIRRVLAAQQAQAADHGATSATGTCA